MFNQKIKERYIEEKYLTTTLPKGIWNVSLIS